MVAKILFILLLLHINFLTTLNVPDAARGDRPVGATIITPLKSSEHVGICSADRRRWCIHWRRCSRVDCLRCTGSPSGRCLPGYLSTCSYTYTCRPRSSSDDQHSSETCLTSDRPLYMQSSPSQVSVPAPLKRSVRVIRIIRWFWEKFANFNEFYRYGTTMLCSLCCISCVSLCLRRPSF